GSPGDKMALLGAGFAVGVSKTLAGSLAPPSITRTVGGKHGVRLDATKEENEQEFREGLQLPTDNIRLRDAVNEFMNIRNSLAPVVIVTGLRKYENFVLTNFEVVREVTLGKTLRVHLEFQEIQSATIGQQIVFVPAVKQALPKASQGK